MAKSKVNEVNFENLNLRDNPIGQSENDGFDPSKEIKDDNSNNDDIVKDESDVIEENNNNDVVIKPEGADVPNDNDSNIDTDQGSLLWEAFAEYNNLNIEGIDTPDTIESFFDRLNEVYSDKTPNYANDTVREIDEFVRNGGDINAYFNTVKVNEDFEDIDLEEIDNQKKVLGEFLRRKGFNESQIKKRIDRYEDADVLEDEAYDAYETLRDMISNEKEELVKSQAEKAKQIEEANKKYAETIMTEINALQDVRGIKVPEKDRKELIDYIFKVESDGYTKYQKDYSKSVKNLIESAYFTMKGDALIDNAKKSGQSDAVKRLKDSLASKNINKSSGRDNFNSGSMIDILSSQLRQ